jgi:large subunit ribosomal protein L25
MADVIITAERRTELGSASAGRYRRQGKLPATVYGLASEPLSVTVSAHDLDRVLHRGANTLITLALDGDDSLTLVRQIQRHPTRGDLVHVDFVRVRRDVAVSAEVTLHLEGDPVGVREGGGLLEQLLFSLTVEAMPGAIPESLTADVSELALGDQLHIGDVPVPPGVAVQHEADELVAQVTVPRGLAEDEEEEGAEGEEGAEEGEGGEAAPAAESTDGGE